MRAQLLLVALCIPCLAQGFFNMVSLKRIRCVSLVAKPFSVRGNNARRHRLYQQTMITSPSRMEAVRLAGTALLGGITLATGVFTGPDFAKADISLSPRCVTGEGADCDSLAEGNEYIKNLQAKSALTKDKFFQDTLDKYNEHNFKDYFRAENKHMVKKKDGKYEILTNEDYVVAEKAGKVKDDVFLD